MKSRRSRRCVILRFPVRPVRCAGSQGAGAEPASAQRAPSRCSNWRERSRSACEKHTRTSSSMLFLRPGTSSRSVSTAGTSSGAECTPDPAAVARRQGRGFFSLREPEGRMQDAPGGRQGERVLNFELPNSRLPITDSQIPFRFQT